MSAVSPLRSSWLGRVDYLDGWRLQDAVATRVRAGDDERLLLLEHDPFHRAALGRLEIHRVPFIAPIQANVGD